MWLSVILKAPLFASHMRQFSQQALHNRLVSSIRYRQNCRPLIAAVQQIKTFHKSVSLSSLEATAPQEKQPNRQRISRKVLRKRRPLTAAYDDQPMSGPQIVAIAVAESFDLSALIKNAQLLQVYQATCVDEESDEGLHFVPKEEYLIDKDAVREFFVFTDGVVVFWGMESAERALVLRYIQNCSECEYDSRTVQEEIDRMPFELTAEGKSQISDDQLLLNVAKYDLRHNSNFSILERFSFSHGMAASVKVAIWEAQLSKQAEPLAETTKALSRGIIPWHRKQALRKTGQFSALRHSINLNCDLLNTDFYWEHEELEQFYDMALRHFTVHRRIVLLNNRLDYCEDLVKLIDGMLSHRHASLLEWMIIVLIVIEVIFDIHSFMDSTPKKVIIYKDSTSSSDAHDGDKHPSTSS